nr:uncharacterized mitochondrial protein AtMg00810-like [Tanacetum cinerariifolium]
CDSIGTPMATKHLDADLIGTSVDQIKYRGKVGALMYLTASRPDIMHATCYCARYQAQPTEKHLTTVKRIFRYLKDTIHIGLWYPKDTGFELTAFSDLDHAGCLDSRKSTSSGIQFLGGDKLVSWSSKKRDCTHSEDGNLARANIKQALGRGIYDTYIECILVFLYLVSCVVIINSLSHLMFPPCHGVTSGSVRSLVALGTYDELMTKRTFKKFLVMYKKFELLLDMFEQLKKFLSFKPHAMSTSSNKSFTSFSKWILDSGATHYMSYLLSQFISFNLNSSKSIVAANGDFMPLIGKLDTNDIFDCSGCKLAKLSTQPFSNSISSSTAPFDLVHYDAWGPAPISTKRSSRYYFSFINDFTHYMWVYLMKRGSDFLTIFKEFSALVKTHHSKVIKCFRYDLRGEYTSNDFLSLPKLDGTIYQTSCTDTPQQNGVAERKHRHLVETTRSFLLSAHIPNVFGEKQFLQPHM